MTQSNLKAHSLTLFYDGFCPLCVAEMKSLAKKDKQHRMKLVDVHEEGALDDYPQINKAAALIRLHAIDEHNQVLVGLDVTHKAWQLVGRGWLIAPLRWPLVRIGADWLYLLFAKHRYRISALLTGKSRCERCELKS